MKNSRYTAISVITMLVAAWCYALPESAVDEHSMAGQADSNKYVMTVPLPITQPFSEGASNSSSKRLVINQKTGQIIQGESVPIYTAAVQYNGMEIKINHNSTADNPKAHTAPESKNAAVTAGKIVDVLINLSVKPAEIIEIFKIFITEGSLHAELVLR